MLTGDRNNTSQYKATKETLLYFIYSSIWRYPESGSLRWMRWAMPCHLTSALEHWLWPNLFSLEGKVHCCSAVITHNFSLLFTWHSFLVALPDFVTICCQFDISHVWTKRYGSLVSFLSLFSPVSCLHVSGDMGHTRGKLHFRKWGQKKKSWHVS